jgi:exosortase E/protease (VPEID-CTERM system)
VWTLPLLRARLPGLSLLTIVRWLALPTLFLAEVAAVSLSFDAAPRGGGSESLGYLITWSPAVARWALAAAGVAAILIAWLYPGEVRQLVGSTNSWQATIEALAGHITSYAIFLILTSAMLGSTAWPVGWGSVCAWLGSGVLTLAFLAVSAAHSAAWRRFLFETRWPLMLAGGVAVAASLVARAARDGWDLLSQPTLLAAYELLRSVIGDVVFDPQSRLLGTPDFTVEVGVPCSGYEGLGLMAVYLGGYLALARKHLRFPRAYLLVPLGLLAVWVVNVVRIVALILIGDRLSPALAIGGFHSQAGWIGFNAVAIGLLVATHRSQLFTKEEVPASSRPNATTAYLAPFLAAVAIQLIAPAVASEPAKLYPLRMLAASAMLIVFWRRYRSLRVNGRCSTSEGFAWAIVSGAVVFGLWLVFSRTRANDSAWLGELTPTWAAAWMAAKLVGFVLVTPLVEELAFRGYLLRRLISADFESVPPDRFTWLSVLVSSLLFGLMHGQWLAGTLAGLAFAGVMLRTGRLRDAVLAHAAANALLAARMVVTGDWTE